MKAIIMAGGEGTRLRPLTSLLPKPMVPIVNQPVMEHILGLVKHHGIDDVVATLAFMPQVIQDYFGDGDEWDMRIDYAIEETPLGTAGSVKNAAKLIPTDEPFIVISGDAVTDINLRELVEVHKAKGERSRSPSRRSTIPWSSASSSPMTMAGSNASWRSPRGARSSATGSTPVST